MQKQYMIIEDLEQLKVINDLAARFMFNTLVKAGCKVSAVGLAAEAAIYGWQSRGEW